MIKAGIIGTGFIGPAHVEAVGRDLGSPRGQGTPLEQIAVETDDFMPRLDKRIEARQGKLRRPKEDDAHGHSLAAQAPVHSGLKPQA